MDSKSTTSQTRVSPRLILIAGDLAVLFLFSFLGREVHDLTGTPDAVLALALLVGEFWAAWLVVGWLAGAFAPVFAPGGSLGGFLRRSLVAWLGAGPVAVLLRAFVLGRAVIPTAFLAVAVSIGGALLLAWRLAFVLYVKRRQGRADSA